MGTIKDLIFDHQTNHVLALLMSEKDLFGLIDAQIIPWDQISHIGPDAVTVFTSHSRINAGADPGVKSVLNRTTALSGTHVYTNDGKDLGTLADTYFDEKTGQIHGYEISGGFVADTMTGKRFLPANHELNIGRDVAIVDAEAASALETQKSQEAGGLSGAAQAAGEQVSGAYETAREKVTDTYASITSTTIEKQQEFVVGKTAARDVILPDQEAPTFREYVPGAPEADVTSTGEVVAGEVLVRHGETITAEHAQRAAAAGVLGPLVAAAVGGAASEAMAAGREKMAGAITSGHEHLTTTGTGLQERAEESAIGKTAAHEVVASDGSILVAEGQIVTEAILENARLYGKEREIIAVAGLGAASETAQDFGQSASETAGNLWEAARQKVAEFTQTAQQKKAEYEQMATQAKIDHALGRPTTRVILDRNDNIILNAGDIITHAAVDRAREAGVLQVLLDSVYAYDPEITPEMLRVNAQGESTLGTQPQPEEHANAKGVVTDVMPRTSSGSSLLQE